MKKFGIYFLLVFPMHAAISIVYNIKVAETSKRMDVNDLLSEDSMATATFFGLLRKKYDGDLHDAQGAMFTLIHDPESYFLRVDGAFARVASNIHGQKFSTVETDDLLFSGGYSHKFSNRLRMTFSGLLGFPTHKDRNLARVQFGYAHYGLGGQCDGSYRYSENHNHTLRGALRLIHFFPRETNLPIDGFCESFNYGLGNLLDIFISFHNKFALHSIEMGYNGSFFMDATIFPRLADAIPKSTYNRTSFYALYKYHFKINRFPSLFGLATSYGFETEKSEFNNKHIFQVWTSFGINF